MQKTSARLRALFERSPDMINLHDIEGQIIKPNPQLCERTGYSEAELTDMSVWDLDTELEPDEATLLWKQMRPGESKRVDSTYRCRDGSTFPVEINIRRLGQGHTDHFVVISRDVEQLGADHPE
nr:PAS domain S-box protein [Halobellus inordinatus]